MSNSRTKNTLRNIWTGLLNKIIIIILPFINRTAIIWLLGAEFTGLSSLFTSILHVLNLAELGFNTAIVYSLYKPMANREEDKICELVSLFKRIYRIVGLVVIILGLSLLPFLHLFIKDSYPQGINIYVVYLLYLINSAISYFLFAYKESLLIADQRKDVSNNIRSFFEILKNLIQFLLLIVTRDYILFLIAMIISTIATNISIGVITKKRYPFYNNTNIKLKIPKEIKKQVSSLMINRICDTFRNSFDSLIISSFFGLIAVGIYSNYFYIYSALYGILLEICNSMGASVGNSIIKKSEKDNYENMNCFYWLFTWIVGVSTVCLGCLYQPFMKIWVGKDLLLSNTNMILFCVYFYLINMNNIRNQYISGLGIWWKLKNSYLIEAIANLLLNIVFGKIFGITGVILATIITIFIFNYLQRNRILFKSYFKNENIVDFYKEQFYFMFLIFISFVISYVICNIINLAGIISLVVYGVISIMITIIILAIGLRFSTSYENASVFIKENLLRIFIRKN